MKMESTIRILTGEPSTLEMDINDIKKNNLVCIMGVSGDADKTVVVIEVFPNKVKDRP